MQVKLFIPSPRAGLVARRRLIETLNLGLARKLTLVSAPAGFGKTTLVTAWLGQIPSSTRVSWLSLDEEDSDSARFFHYFIHALQTIDPSIGQDLLSAGSLPSPQLVVSHLLLQIGHTVQSGILVLDDYHVIQQPEIHRALDQFLEYLPPHLHIVLISRADPSFSISKLRVRQQMVEIRARDLRFTSSEIQEYIHQSLHHPLSPGEISLLGERTEGWIAALQLAALSLNLTENPESYLKEFAGTDRYIADYLLEEVLSKLDENVQSFLFKTSIFDRFNSSLCDAVLQRTGSQSILEYLDQSNLFVIPLDNRRKWYRYHHLFGDLLRERHAIDADEIEHLHRLAAGWFEENDQILEAAAHRITAKDYDEAIQALLSNAVHIFVSGQLPQLTQLWQRFPEKNILANPGFGMMMAWAFLATGRPDVAENCLQGIEHGLDVKAQSLLENIETLSPKTRHALIEVAVVRMSFQSITQVNKREVLNLCEKIMPYLHEDNQVHLYSPTLTLRPVVLFNAGIAYKAIGQLEQAAEALRAAAEQAIRLYNIHIFGPAIAHLAEISVTKGKLHEAAELCKEGLDRLEQLGGQKSPMAGLLHVRSGQLYQQWNDLGRAVQHYEKAVELAIPWRNTEVLAPAYEGLLRAFRRMGEPEKADLAFRQFEELKLDNAAGQPMVEAYQALIHFHQGKTAPAQTWIDNRYLSKETPLSEAESVLMAKMLLELGHAAQTADLAAELGTKARENRNFGSLIELFVIQCRAFIALGQHESARIALGKALDLAEENGYLQTFIDGGEPLLRLLDRSIQDGTVPQYAARIAAIIRANNTSTRASLDAGEMVEPLSEREMEVLRFIAQGLTNQQIADRLFLTVGTIKVHAHNIYGKLGVSNRTRAVKKAEEIGLL